ncbi:hypothetical protein QOZ80_4BG0343960 [Eleusine coracana subsp. coracana]|nr:hypothetical protein QOZ80_4BG0343960 [Eleusine coracana subsp. coracana]
MISRSAAAAGSLRASLRRACFSQAADPDNLLLGLVDVPEPIPHSRLSPKDFAFLQDPAPPLRAAALPPPEAVLLSKAIRAFGTDFDGKAVRFLRRHRQFLTDAVVVAVLRSVRVPELCVRFFLWAEGQVGYSHTGACYDALAEVLDFDDRAKTSDRLLREIEEEDREVLGRLLNVLVRRCCRRGVWMEALEELGRLKDFGYRPSSATYNVLVQVLSAAGQMDMGFRVQREMSESGFSMDRFTVGCFAQALCKEGRSADALVMIEKEDFKLDTVLCTQMISGLMEASLFDEAISFLHRMRCNLCIPNVVTYRTLLSGFLEKKQLGWCKRIINMMMKEGENTDTMMPNVVTYGALIDGLCKAHKVTDARELLDAMLSTGCEPNHIIYDALIDGFCKVGKIDNAQEVFLRMSKCGYLPTVHTYTSLIDAMFKDRRLDLAMKVLSQMLKGSCTPNVVTYTAMIAGLCRIGESEKALKLLSMMERKGCIPNVVTYTALIDGLGKAGKVDISLKLFKEMSTRGCAPNYVTYRVLINNCCAAGLLDKAHSLLSEMKQTYWPKYLQGYRFVVQGYSKKFIASLGLLEEMESHGTAAIAPVYGMLIDNFSKAGRVEKALELHKEMMEVLSSLNLTSKETHTSLIRALCLASQIDKAFELYSEMTRNGIVPELSDFVWLIMGLIKIDKWNEALQLCYCICHEGVNWQGNKSFDGGQAALMQAELHHE